MIKKVRGKLKRTAVEMLDDEVHFPVEEFRIVSAASIDRFKEWLSRQ